MPHPWKHSRPGWTGLWTTWSGWRCPCSLQGDWARRSVPTQTILWFYEDVKNKAHPKTDISEHFWSVFCSGYTVSSHVWEGMSTQSTNLTLLTACNMSQNRRFKVNMKLFSFYFCFPSGFLQEKEKQRTWQLTTRDIHTSLLREQHGFSDRPCHLSSQQTWDLDLATSGVNHYAVFLLVPCLLKQQEALAQWDLKLLIFLENRMHKSNPCDSSLRIN